MLLFSLMVVECPFQVWLRFVTQLLDLELVSSSVFLLVSLPWGHEPQAVGVEYGLEWDREEHLDLLP